MSGSLSVISHRTAVLSRLDSCINSAMREMEKEAVDWVQEQMLFGYHDPHGKDGHTEIYQSGYMSEKSIKAKAQRDSQNTYTLSVGTDAPYGPYVHYGTIKLKGRPFLDDGLAKNVDKQKQIYLKHLKSMNNI